MRLQRTLINVVAIVWLSALPLAAMVAQESALNAGARIRIHRLSGRGEIATTGTFVSASAESLTFRNSRDVIESVPRANVMFVERATYSGRHVADGAILGLISGALLAGIIGEATSKCPKQGDCYKELGVLAGAAAGGLAGMTAGAAIGSSIRSERWESVALREWLSFSSTGTPFHVGMTMRFRLGFVYHT